MILVTGPTGNVGQHVVRELLRRGSAVRALAGPGTGMEEADGLEIRYGDLRDPGVRAAAVEGVEKVFLLAVPDAAEGLAAAAKKAGARAVVLLSSLTADPAAVGLTSLVGDRHRRVEAAVEETGLSWTHLRPNLLMSNALMWAESIAEEGVVRWPYGGAALSPVHERDIAAVAVEALLSDGHGNTVHALTGPESLTQVEQVRVIGEAVGAPLRYEELPADAGRAELARRLPEDAVDAVMRFFELSVGRDAYLAPTVREVTGRDALTFARWAEEKADAFRGPWWRSCQGTAGA